MPRWATGDSHILWFQNLWSRYIYFDSVLGLKFMISLPKEWCHWCKIHGNVIHKKAQHITLSNGLCLWYIALSTYQYASNLYAYLLSNLTEIKKMFSAILKLQIQQTNTFWINIMYLLPYLLLMHYKGMNMW